MVVNIISNIQNIKREMVTSIKSAKSLEPILSITSQCLTIGGHNLLHPVETQSWKAKRQLDPKSEI